ncbi:MAG: COX15/CtaA family protein [Acidobacteriota bacterium]
MRSTVVPISSGRHSGVLSVYAAIVMGFMVLVILEGAVVRATGSGAGCGDHWPLCNGVFFPHHPRLATLIEYTHRFLTGICTALLAVLIGWTFLARPSGHRARQAAVWSGVLLITEALLGALLVKGGYVENNASGMRVLMQCIHFSNTMLLLAAITLTWSWLRDLPQPAIAGSRARGAAWLALGTTLLVGALGAVAALADTLYPPTSLHSALLSDFAAHAPLLVHVRWLHPVSALVALGCAIWLAAQTRGSLGRLVLALIGLQIFLGAMDVLSLAPALMQVLHLLGADLYWIALVVVCATILAPMPGPRSVPSSVSPGQG